MIPRAIPVKPRDIRLFRAGFLLAAICTLANCSTYGYKTPLGENTYAPVDYHKVKLLFAAPTEKYEVIGVVSVQGGVFASAGDMYQKLLKSAAKLGADAVIVTGEGNLPVILPGSTYTTANASVYGNTVTGNALTTSSPTVVADMPTNKGLAIRYTP